MGLEERLAKKPLTAFAIEHAKPKAKRYALPDLGHPGLRVLVQPSGAKSFVYRFKRGKQQDVTLTLGPANGPGALTLAQARDAASEARRQRATGIDPADQKRQIRKAEIERIKAEERESRRREDTIENVLNRFYADHVDGLRSAKENKRLLSKELAEWKRRRIDDISEADAIKLVDGIRARGAVHLSNRTRAHSRKFFNWCIQKQLVEKNPFSCVPASRERSRQRVLTDDELRWLLLALPALDWPWRDFFKVALYLGQRREEIAGMRWAEINLKAAEPVWVLHADRAKNDSTHVVPLPATVVAILSDIDRVVVSEKIGDTRETASPFVFTTTGKSSISGFSKAMTYVRDGMLSVARKEAEERGEDPDSTIIEPWRLHDLRRTMVSNMARLEVDVGVVERVVNHTMPRVMATYQQFSFQPQKRNALNKWANFLDDLTTTPDSNVVSFKAEA